MCQQSDNRRRHWALGRLFQSLEPAARNVLSPIELPSVTAMVLKILLIKLRVPTIKKKQKQNLQTQDT